MLCFEGICQVLPSFNIKEGAQEGTHGIDICEKEDWWKLLSDTSAGLALSRSVSDDRDGWHPISDPGAGDMAWDGLGWPLIRSRGCYTCHIQLASVFRAPFVLLCKVNRLTDKVLVCWTIWHCASLFNVRNNGPVSLFWPSGDPIYQMPDWCTTQKVSVWIQPFLYVWWLIFAYLPPNCFTAKLRWHI